MASAGSAKALRGNAPGKTSGIAREKPRGRLIQLDVLRGFLLVWMTLTHLPTRASTISNQTFGFVSGAEGFIFLAAFMVGQLEYRKDAKEGPLGSIRDIFKRTLRIYIYHCALLAVAFTVVAHIGVTFQRQPIENLLSYYLQSPREAVIAAALLEYRPSLLDILPMYIVFMVLTPVARWIARRWSWDPVIWASLTIWAAAQFGLRPWLYRQGDLFGLSVPENSTGAFDLYGWQLLWMVGLALGTINADALAHSADTPGGGQAQASEMAIPRWLLTLSIALATIFLVLRYSAVENWMNPAVQSWLTDKWHLGPARVMNFAAIAIALVRFGTRIAALPFLMPLAMLGQASLEVFSVHILCCLAGDALSREADPNLPLWQQATLLALTMSALFLTAYAHRWRAEKKRAAPPA